MEKKLVRDTQNQVFGGVCSGIANYVGWDPTLVRVIAVLLAVFSFGTAVLVYVVLWIVMPSDVSVYGPPQPPRAYQDGFQQGYWEGLRQGQAENRDHGPR